MGIKSGPRGELFHSMKIVDQKHFRLIYPDSVGSCVKTRCSASGYQNMSLTFVVLTVNSQQYQTHARVGCIMKTHHMWSGAHRQVAQLFMMSLTKIFSSIFAVCLTPSMRSRMAVLLLSRAIDAFLHVLISFRAIFLTAHPPPPL